MGKIKKKKVFGLGDLFLQFVPNAYFLGYISTHCVVCGKITNLVAKNNEKIKSCCEACFDTPEIDVVFVKICNSAVKTNQYNVKGNVIYLAERR